SVAQTTIRKYTGPKELEQLLLYHRGVLDINSSSRDEFSWYVSGYGGIFTFELTSMLSAGTTPNWVEFLSTLSEQVNESFQVVRSQILGNPGKLAALDLKHARDQKSMKPAIFQMALEQDERVEARPEYQVHRTARRFVFELGP